MSQLQNRLKFQIAQLRHAYKQLSEGNVKLQKEFADGLISPAIVEFENSLKEIEELEELAWMYKGLCK